MSCQNSNHKKIKIKWNGDENYLYKSQEVVFPCSVNIQRSTAAIGKSKMEQRRSKDMLNLKHIE